MNQGTPAGHWTELLRKWRAGDREALETLAPLVEESLRRIARRLLARERPNLTLDQTTALVNQSYTRLLHQQEVSWQNREIRRRIRKEDAPLPSVRVRSASHAESAAAQRDVPTPLALARELHGDLDWIVSKALAKNRSDRYATALELGEDVQRHLDDDPVRASPPTRSLRSG